MSFPCKTKSLSIFGGLSCKPRDDMAIFLDEDEIGVDTTMIGYPHLLLCMGVAVVMNDGSLIGAHVSNQTTEANVLNGLLQKVTAHGGNMSQLYCFANMAEHVTRHGCMDITGKANAIGFHGQGYSFDFAFMKPKDGAYCEITTTGAGSVATVRYKRNEKLDYARGGGATVTKSTKDWHGKAKQFDKPSVVTAAAPKDKTFLGFTTGQHHLNTATLTPVSIP